MLTQLFISTHFLDNKRGAESPGPSAVLDHGKLTPWIRKHPIQFGTQRRGLTLAEVRPASTGDVPLDL